MKALKIAKTFAGIGCACGIFSMLGAVGYDDYMMSIGADVSFMHTMIRVLVGMVISYAGFVAYKTIDEQIEHTLYVRSLKK